MRSCCGARSSEGRGPVSRRTVAAKLLRTGVLACGLALVVAGPVVGQTPRLVFPADDGMHRDASFETWTGFAHLRSSDGAEYSAFAIFFTGWFLGLGVSGVYGALLDTRSGEFLDDRDLVVPIFGRADHTTGRLNERYDSSVLARADERSPYDLSVRTSNLRFAFTMAPTRDPVSIGRVDVGPGRTQQGYVVPHAKVVGVLRTADGREVQVTGGGIFQHLWGDTPDESAAQDIIAIHLDQGTDLFTIAGPTAESTVLVVADAAVSRTIRDGVLLRSDSLVEDGSLSFRRRWHLQVQSPALDLHVEASGPGRRVSLLGGSPTSSCDALCADRVPQESRSPGRRICTCGVADPSGRASADRCAAYDAGSCAGLNRGRPRHTFIAHAWFAMKHPVESRRREPSVADTCDGDGGTHQVMSAAPPGAPVALSLELSGAPAHRAQLCHCAHVHGGQPGIAASTPDVRSVSQRPPRSNASAPRAAAVEPRLRPPLMA